MALVGRDFQLWLLLIGFCVVFNCSNAVDLCHNNKLGCPSGTTRCTDDKWCCKNDTCNQRATWSIISDNICPEDVENCPPNKYCSYKSKKRSCTPRGVSICDQYLHIHDNSTCNERSFLVDQMFESCSYYYTDHYDEDLPLVNSVMACAEQCVIDRVKSMLSNSTLCSGLQYNTYSQYPSCFSNCKMCFVSHSWGPAIVRIGFENAHHTSIIDDLAIECNKQFTKNYDESRATTIKDKVLEFIAIFKKYTKINTRRHFEKLLETQKDTSTPAALTFDLSLNTILLVSLLLVTVLISIIILTFFACCRKSQPIPRPESISFLRHERPPQLPNTPVPSPSRERRAVNVPAVRVTEDSPQTSNLSRDSKYVSLDSNQYELRKPSNELFVHMKTLSK